MLILGLNHGKIGSSAALYKDGKIIAGHLKKDLIAKKRPENFPITP